MSFPATDSQPSLGPALETDARAIADLLERARGDCLPLSADEIRRRLPEFEVARSPSGWVLASAAVRHLRADRAELRCVVVDPAHRGRGLGRRLVQRAVRRAHASGRELFCVSRRPAFFQALGFERLPDADVPTRPHATQGPPRRALIHRRAIHREVSA